MMVPPRVFYLSCLLASGCAAQATLPATAYVVYYRNGAVIGTFDSMKNCEWARENDLQHRTNALADHLGLTFERTKELLEAEMSPCMSAWITQSTAGAANYWITFVKRPGQATVLIAGPTEIECQDLVWDLTCRPVRIERR
jgi:glucose dehydrogenase